MRFGLTLFKGRGRSPQSENKVPLNVLSSVALKDRVSNKGFKSTENNCLQELSVFLTCLRENEYENSRCAKEFTMFSQCTDKYNKSIAALKAARLKVVPEPNTKLLTDKQVSYFLRKYSIH